MSSPYLSDFSAGFANDPPSSVGAEGGPQPFSNRSRHWDSGQMQVPGQVRYLGHWPELLADLALLGRVWIETEQPGIRIAQRRRLSGLRVHGMLGYLDTPEYQVRILLDQCHALNARDDGQGLVIEDRSMQPLVSVQLEAGALPLPLRLLLSSLGADDRRVVPAPHRQDEPRIAALEQHAIHRLQRDCQALEPEPGYSRSEGAEPGFPGLEYSGLRFRDLAELSGRLSGHPLPLRQAVERGDDQAIAVDPSLVPCALETLVDQVHPLAFSSGSGGWVSRSIEQFYAHAYVDGQLSLRGDEARLELDVHAIDSAWVVGEHTGEVDRRSLRLYDEDGRAMAVIASAAESDDCVGSRSTGAADLSRPATSPGFRSQDRPQGRTGFRRDEARLWTTLMNALTS